MLLLRQRSSPIVKTFPGVNYVSIIRVSGLPVGLAIEVILDGVPLDGHPLRLLPDARLLLVLLGLRLRVAMGEQLDPTLRISLLLQTTRFGC